MTEERILIVKKLSLLFVGALCWSICGFTALEAGESLSHLARTRNRQYWIRAVLMIEVSFAFFDIALALAPLF